MLVPFSRFALLLSLALMLGACGFEPLAARHKGDTSTDLASIDVDPVDGRTGQLFRARLQDLLNPGNVEGMQKIYRLSPTLTHTAVQAVVAPNGSVLRYDLHMQSSYTLTRISDGKLVQKGDFQRVGSYNSLPNAYLSSYASEQDALENLARTLAEEYRMRLAGILAQESIHSANP